jgi:hypothetical protein
VAQYWPEKDWVELAILDEGVGIRSTLARNPHLAIPSDIGALRLALLPGVSGVAFKGGPRQRKDAWANSGYGLYMTSQLCARGGSFLICSGSAGLFLERGVETTFETNFAGTALRLCLSTTQLGSLSATLEHLRKAGSEVARGLAVGANVTASMSARSLKKDF